jgi:hypothetical protein
MHSQRLKAWASFEDPTPQQYSGSVSFPYRKLERYEFRQAVTLKPNRHELIQLAARTTDATTGDSIA